MIFKTNPFTDKGLRPSFLLMNHNNCQLGHRGLSKQKFLRRSLKLCLNGRVLDCCCSGCSCSSIFIILWWEAETMWLLTVTNKLMSCNSFPGKIAKITNLIQIAPDPNSPTLPYLKTYWRLLAPPKRK